MAGHPRKTTPKTDHILKRAVMNQPSLNSKELKDSFPELLAGVSQTTVQHHPKRDLGLPACNAAK